MSICKFIGMDVHAGAISMEVAKAGERDVEYAGNIVVSVKAIKRALAKVSHCETHVMYEAGPTGYQLYRELK